ncbi:MAG TPA: nitrous oxide reductase accessory protein NosL [Caldilineaceae bacterium]|nr:nitrous oxide reductase accessory protein NosL [Caldilineaceae bacterium]
MLVLLALTLLAGCARGSAAPAPPEIRYGEDQCAHCTMIISDPRFAAGIAYEIEPGRYESLAFDDIGDMLAEAGSHPERVVVDYYVHDYTSEEWLDATEAHFVVSPAIPSPMGSGIAAHASAEAAAAHAAELQGRVLTWDELQNGGAALAPSGHTDHQH